MLLWGLSIILLAVFLLPFLSKKIEHNLEIFLFVMGLVAAGVARVFDGHLMMEALHEPIPITFAVITFGLLFKWSRTLFDRAIATTLKIIPRTVFIFLLVLLLGALSSLITAIIAALILVEVISLLNLDKAHEQDLVIIACFAIGLGAALTPLGEPLATIAIAKLKSWPDVNFWFLAKLLGWEIGIGILLLSILSMFFHGKEDAKTLTAELKDRVESYPQIFLRGGKVYIFVMALIFLGAGFKPVIDQTLVALPADLLYWINMISAVLDNATLTAAEISPAMTPDQIKKILMGLLIAGGMLIPGNIPNIIAAGKLKIGAREWARLGVPLGLILMALFFFLIGLIRPAYADDYNYQNFVVGERAAGMGGAYTALSESPEGTYYNPGGLVFSKNNRISLSTIFFRRTTGTLNNRVSIRLGADSLKEDLPISSFEIIPSGSSATRTFNFKRDEEKKVDPGKWNAWALSLYTPDSILRTGTKNATSGNIDSHLNFRLQDSLVLAGPSYSRRITENLGIGVSLFYSWRRYLNESFVVADNDVVMRNLFTHTDYQYGGLVGVLGVKWRAHPQWHLGASVMTPSLRLFGGGVDNSSLSTEGAVDRTNPNQDLRNPRKTLLNDLKVNLPQPIKITTGVAFLPHSRWTLSGDASLYLPNDFSAVHDPQGRAGDAIIKQQMIVNGNIGAEYRFRPQWPLRWGAFTNFSSSPPLGTRGASGSKIDYYGGSVSFAYDDAPFATHFGTQIAYGKGDHQVSGTAEKFSLLNITALFGSSFRF